jgi:hypothetical protein
MHKGSSAIARFENSGRIREDVIIPTTQKQGRVGGLQEHDGARHGACAPLKGRKSNHLLAMGSKSAPRTRGDTRIRKAKLL